MSAPSDTIIETIKVREVAGVFDSREQIDDAVDALLLASFDRADIDCYPAEARRRLGARDGSGRRRPRSASRLRFF